MAKPAPVENCYDDPEPILAAKTGDGGQVSQHGTKPG